MTDVSDKTGSEVIFRRVRGRLVPIRVQSRRDVAGKLGIASSGLGAAAGASFKYAQSRRKSAKREFMRRRVVGVEPPRFYRRGVAGAFKSRGLRKFSKVGGRASFILGALSVALDPDINPY